MTSVIDLWRVVDSEARLVSGSLEALRRPARGVVRSRAAPPHLPPASNGALLVLDGSLIAGQTLDDLLNTLRAAEFQPVAVVLAGMTGSTRLDPIGDELPILTSTQPIAMLSERFAAYLRDEPSVLLRLATELRLALAEAALADPDPATPAGLVAARIRRGVAVVADGELRALHPRAAGRALAARFAAAHARLLGGGAARAESLRRTRDGLWTLERRVRPGASVWLFDDLPFAATDAVAAEALTITLRALLRRSAAPRTSAHQSVAAPPPAPDPEGRIAQTLLAVARTNGRVAPAARALGVHRNTVLYRLRVGLAQFGIDPRRPQDALRILADAERRVLIGRSAPPAETGEASQRADSHPRRRTAG